MRDCQRHVVTGATFNPFDAIPIGSGICIGNCFAYTSSFTDSISVTLSHSISVAFSDADTITKSNSVPQPQPNTFSKSNSGHQQRLFRAD
jgi:hypothetical protein